MGRGGGGERKEKKQLGVYPLSECEGVAARWEKVLAEEEGGDGRAATLRPIYPKLTGLKKAVKSECDVSKRMFLEVANQLGEHTLGFCGQRGVATESSKTSLIR